MRILFLSAFYPPHVIGGWEQLVHDINIRLQDRGHTTHVLTSTYGVRAPQHESDVDRLLTLESDLVQYQPHRFFLGRRRRLQRNLDHLRATVTDFDPDVIFIHVMWNLARQLAWLAEQLLPGRVVYYVANDWPYAPTTHEAYWRESAARSGRDIFKRLIAPFALRAIEREGKAYPLRFEHVLCVSDAMRQNLARYAGIPANNMYVVYNGVELDQFTPAQNPNGQNGYLSLVYAGSLVPHKGVHTAIEALAHVKRHNELDGLELTIVGSGHPAYEERLRRIVDDESLGRHVRFCGRVPRDAMPALLRSFDALIFPSIWEEPLARTMQEAMASGLVVIGTTTGGSCEILFDGETGLTFDVEDSAGLARQIARLRHSDTLRAKLVENGRRLVTHTFNLERMIDEIEYHLASCVNGKNSC